jgi:hypothetical protein
MSSSDKDQIFPHVIQTFGYGVILPVAVLIFIGIWGFTHWTAQDCERVSVWWGLVEYTKGGCKSGSPTSPQPSASHQPALPQTTPEYAPLNPPPVLQTPISTIPPQQTAPEKVAVADAPLNSAPPTPEVATTQAVAPIVLHHGETYSAENISITALFNNIGGEVFVTLRITPDNAATFNKPVMGGETFEISTSAGDFELSVLSLDNATQTVTVKLNPTP